MGYQVNSENIYMSGHEHLLSQRSRCSKHIINLILKLDIYLFLYVNFDSHMVSFMM